MSEWGLNSGPPKVNEPDCHRVEFTREEKERRNPEETTGSYPTVVLCQSSVGACRLEICYHLLFGIHL